MSLVVHLTPCRPLSGLLTVSLALYGIQPTVHTCLLVDIHVYTCHRGIHTSSMYGQVIHICTHAMHVLTCLQVIYISSRYTHVINVCTCHPYIQMPCMFLHVFKWTMFLTMPSALQAVELLRQLATVDPAEYERQHDAGGVRNVANFLVELADRSVPTSGFPYGQRIP